MDFYLGLTGLPGTGKEAVSKLITAELAAHGIQTVHYSLSGPIALELRRRGLPPDREQLRAMANEVRANLGNGAWASRIAREAHELLSITAWADLFVMIDGVRNPAEIAVFRELWGSRFHLLAVNAPEAVRRRNLAVRSSPKDAAVLAHLATAAADSAAIAPVLTAEMGIGQPQHGTNVLACIELADWTLENAEHDPAMAALREQVQGLVARQILPLYGWGAAPGAGVAPVAAASPAHSVRQGGGAARVLVVESDPAWQARLTALLEEEGCAVEFAASYAEASRKLLDQPLAMPYALLTVDLELAGEPASGGDGREAGSIASCPGFDLLESLHYFGRSLPSVFVSARAEAEMVGRAFRDFGVRDYCSKEHFSADAFRARVRSLVLSPFYVVASLETGAAEHLLAGQVYSLWLRVQRDAPLHPPPLGGVLCLRRPCTAEDWPVEVVATGPDLPFDWQPRAGGRLIVPADCLAAPLVYTLTPLAAGNGRVEIEFHRRGEYVERLGFDVAVRAGV